MASKTTRNGNLNEPAKQLDVCGAMREVLSRTRPAAVPASNAPPAASSVGTQTPLKDTKTAAAAEFDRVGFLAGYGKFGVGQAVFFFLSTFLVWRGCLRAGVSIHESLLGAVIRYPMRFFNASHPQQVSAGVADRLRRADCGVHRRGPGSVVGGRRGARGRPVAVGGHHRLQALQRPLQGGPGACAKGRHLRYTDQMRARTRRVDRAPARVGRTMLVPQRVSTWIPVLKALREDILPVSGPHPRD